MGMKLSEECKKKLSAIRKGRKVPWLIGKKLSDEHKAKLSASQKAKSVSETTRNKIRQAMIEIWKNRPRESKPFLKVAKRNVYGRKQTEETKLKISRTLKGREISKEHREKIIKNLIGGPLSLKGKTSPRKGMKLSFESLQKRKEKLMLKKSQAS
jgi:hypothetical protein